MDTHTVRISHEDYMRQREKDLDVDMVNDPPHYNQGDISCIDAIESALGPEGFKAYCRGNALKYLWRVEHKHKDSSDDWAKANWYINRAYRNKTENL